MAKKKKKPAAKKPAAKAKRKPRKPRAKPSVSVIPESSPEAAPEPPAPPELPPGSFALTSCQRRLLTKSIAEFGELVNRAKRAWGADLALVLAEVGAVGVVPSMVDPLTDRSGQVIALKLRTPPGGDE